MQRNLVIVLAVIAALSLVLLPGTPAGAFPAAQRSKSAALTLFSTAGTTSYMLTLAYPINPMWDGVLGYTSSSVASSFEIGGRYYFPSRPRTPRLFAGLDYVSPSGGTSSLVLEAGASMLLSPGWTGFAALNTSLSGGAGLGYDVGVEYSFAPRTSAWLGVLGTGGGGSSVYLGVNFRF